MQVVGEGIWMRKIRAFKLSNSIQAWDDDPTGETTIFPLTLAGQESSAVPRFSPSAPVSHEASEVGTDLVAPAEFWWFWGRDV